jgi:peptidoglycan/LPS O-acetylase OafA/YrhL
MGGPMTRLNPLSSSRNSFMRDIAFVFFLAAVLCVTGGMFWGLQMGASGDHSMVGAHAHLNLAGWATMALFGIYYRLTPQAARGWLPKVHAVLAIAGTAVLVFGVATVTRGGSELPAILGGVVTFASMLVFLFTVVRHGFGASTSQSRGVAGGVLTPAE